MPHTYECPLRWADMDLLGHVNNVTYLDYVTEAREALFTGHPAGRASVVRHQVDFVQPLVFHRRPVLVDTWLSSESDDEVELSHEVYDAPTGAQTGSPPDARADRMTYVRATTVLAHRLTDEERALLEPSRASGHEWRPVAVEARSAGHRHALTVRLSDLDGEGQARPGIFFEYVMEARIRYLMTLHTRGEKWTQHVVARTDIDYLGTLPYRQEPYSVHSWLAHLGSRSFTISSEVRDDDQVIASAAVVMVAFDPETQTTTEMAEQQRTRLEQELARD